MKKICAITMARNDNFFLERWIEYYSEQIGKENLFPILDGLDQKEPNNADGVNIKKVEHKKELSLNGKDRLDKLSNLASELFDKGYDVVIGSDVDEFLVVDPNTNKTLKEYLSEINLKTPTSGLGIDIGHHLEKEAPINNKQPFLAQRSYGVVSSRYTKPVVIASKVRWGGGLHRVKNKNFKIDKNLFLFHFGMCDEDLLKAKLSNSELDTVGWEKHLKRRMKIINLVTNKKDKAWETHIPFARFIQSYFRALYAWNKPSMWFWKLIVKIPDRFNKFA